MNGCTNREGRERCDPRKAAMLAAVDKALARLYPTRRWGELDDHQCLGQGVSEREGAALAQTLARELKTAAHFRRGGYDEYGNYVYVLCVGREPCLVEIHDAAPVFEELPGQPIRELYLRVCLSALARMGGIQECSIELEFAKGRPVLRERVRDGVYDAELLPRMRKLVAILPRFDILSVDFGDISEPPAGFDPGEYGTLYGGEPDTANYLFYPQPSNLETTSWLDDPGDEVLGREARSWSSRS